MSDDKPLAQGGHGRTIKVYENRVEIKYNMWKTVTVPIKRIDAVEISRLSNQLIIRTEKEEHKISMGTHGKAQEVRDAIISRM